ncbi:winged helix DNA-binding domain-containing protein [Yinghuangia seranimata]|uniref:winged helix DNA-binding domain-containing protein n=1 Tax=Yinghuangia seranimata TaxID=408067 RepID=UPI00248C7C3F|nr:winged helix DNA-binding domain-containing protein [Yinghuangia seranimata]MDI2126923.1 winged helix DNA-binding domain-containing protein [Yinghuangia seranimata]
MTGAPQLDVRALSRATLDRQLLLRRDRRSAAEAIQHLVGMQGQAPNAPYVGLWTRLADFATDDLAGLLAARDALRMPLMRVTVHLVTAADARVMVPLLSPMFERSFAISVFGKALAGTDYKAVSAYGRTLITDTPLTRAELAERLSERWPDADPMALAYAATHLRPNVQVPPRGLWGQSGPPRWTPAETWLGGVFDAAPSLDAFVLRYLGAFGPASVKDAQMWSGLTRLREVFDRLGPRLVRFRGPDGAELFDLPDAPRPPAETPAPLRFLPEYDNLLLSHADRSRVIVGKRRVPLPPGNGGTTGTLLVDGFFEGMWKIVRKGGTAVLQIDPFRPLDAARRAEAEEEGRELLRFAAAEADPEAYDVRISDPA